MDQGRFVRSSAPPAGVDGHNKNPTLDTLWRYAAAVGRRLVLSTEAIRDTRAARGKAKLVRAVPEKQMFLIICRHVRAIHVRRGQAFARLAPIGRKNEKRAMTATSDPGIIRQL